MSCNESSKNLSTNLELKRSDSIRNYYPKLVDSLGLEHLFDQAKWTLYCIGCNDSALFMDTSLGRPIQFGFLDLRFKELTRSNDSIEFHFAYYKDSIECNEGSIRNSYNIDGVLFKDKQLVAFTTRTTLRYFWEHGATSRYEHPLQPDVINFIKKYNKALDPWFYKEAVKRGVIK